MNMKHQRHKRKESFSILVLSNTGESRRQFYVPRSFFRLVFIILILICLAAAWMIYEFVSAQLRQSQLQSQIEEQEQTISQLNTEKKSLTKEVASPRPSADADTQKQKEKTVLPNHYPVSGGSSLAGTFSDEHPYFTLTVSAKGKIVAAGNGTISIIGSSSTYPFMIEITHENGYRTRYMSRKKVKSKVKSGAKVKEGDTLFTILKDKTLVDYQIVTEELIDPMTIVDAKG